ncbi:MAG: signal peptidase I [Patescibacteria group bacterium]
MIKTPLIEFVNVSKTFLIHPDNQLKNLVLNKKPVDIRIGAAKQLNFKINRGEIIGLYGPNGSGKSTILRLAAGILQPDSGKINVQGSIASVIELGAGLHYDLTGRENIGLYATILGVAKEKLDVLKKKAIEFADIGNFLDTPLKFYSTGMRARLATSIALFADADILLLDEAISVGDADFREKFIRTIKKIKKNKAILFVTHDVGLLQHLSDRVLLINHGGIDNAENEIAIWKIQNMPVGGKFKGKVQSNSMYPALKRGDVLTIHRTNFSDVNTGDIIAFTLSNIPQVIVHRVAYVNRRRGDSYCLTRGDASIGLDVWKVSKKDYLGKIIPNG